MNWKLSVFSGGLGALASLAMYLCGVVTFSGVWWLVIVVVGLLAPVVYENIPAR